MRCRIACAHSEPRCADGRAVALLLDPRYRRLLAETHPDLHLSDQRLPVPTFVAPLDVREPILPGATRRMVSAFAPVFPGYVVPRSLFLGTPFERYDQSHLLDEVEDVAALAAEAERAARAEDLELVVLCNASPDHPRIQEWFDAGYTPLPSFPDTLVPLDVDDFATHLMRIPQGDRSGVRRNIKKFDRAGHRLARVTDSAPIADALYAAYRPLFERAAVRWQPHTQDYFGRLTELGDAVRLTVAFDPQDEVAGFIVNFEDGTDFQAGRVGINPRYDRRDAVYFRLMYHAVEESLQFASGPQAKLSLEPTGYRMKRHLGATKRSLVNLVRGVSWKWRTLLSGFAGVGRSLLSHLDDERTLERSY